MQKSFIFPALLCVSLSGCDFFVDSKVKVEQQYLAQHQELKQAVEDIREQGLDAVSAAAEKGSVAACVTKQLEMDPMGKLIAVEGALQDSANLAALINTIEDLTAQELSLESIPGLLRQGSDTLSYLRTLLSTYELSDLQQQTHQLLKDGKTQSQNIGEHLRNLIEQCN
ncbi:hypothetical protein [Pseudoalteromonas byunsanensis]|uniref:Lipoprotein n=1 Tax=Pseudoalteromonas byunsanensis TaxID=327939 RepID=A0A1S1N831_9GAMM|nr:hypothetical protein [Pseudoalteromonas byunsanensis]OHU95497.1 hypothetical protein BIW53_09700 [Pseudoalteromonas byunsanensis]